MTARVLLVGSLAVAAIGGVLDGCGRSLLPGDPGGAGTGGSATAGGTAGTGGASGSGGAGGSTAPGGTTGSGGASGSVGASGSGGAEPACAPSVNRNTPCRPEDQQLCYKRCGPENVGVKEVTCGTTPISPVAPVYIEGVGCPFDTAADYSCYKIPTAANAACPAGVTPMTSMDCGTVPRCVLCNSIGGLPGGHYFDANGTDKVGYCVCQLPNAAGLRTWSCASDTAWPCPSGISC